MRHSGEQLSQHEAASDPDSVLSEYGDTPMQDDEFFDNRIADYATPAKSNAAVNNNEADWLVRATYCLGFGILFQALMFVYAVL